jgi:hypothetical protein
MTIKGYVGDCLCLFCRDKAESRDHLYFEWPFSNQIWKTMLHRYLFYRDGKCWDDKLKWAISSFKERRFKATLCRLASNARIYVLWIDRNAQVHGVAGRSEKGLVKHIMNNVRFRIATMKNVPNTLRMESFALFGTSFVLYLRE